MRRRRAAAIVLALAAIDGCGSPAPPPPRATAQMAKVAQANRTHEYVGSREPRQHADASRATAVRAIWIFATAYINWSARTVAADMRALAMASIGQARAAMELAAAAAAHDYELQRGGIANSGMVEAVAPLIGSRDQYVVVTRELTSASDTSAYQGLRPAWHLAIATVAEIAPAQWVLSGWQPES